MNLHNFINACFDSERIERKIIFSLGQSAFVEGRLKSSGFNPIYDDRYITSIYFDDIEFNSLRDNIDGNHSRDKFRIRYYNSNFSEAFIEVKHKRGILGYKYRKELSPAPSSYKDLLDIGQKWSNINLNKKYFPVSKISYMRRYFFNKGFRATIDNKIKSERLVGSTALRSSMFKYEVVEFKYQKHLDESFRSIYNNFANFALRTTKSSKYSNSLMY